MSLLRAADDEWTPMGIKSSFLILIPDGRDPEFKHEGETPICGLGWRFSCSVETDSTPHSTVFVDTGGNMLPTWRISLFFDPHIVRSANYGVLSFSIHAPDLLVPKDANHSRTVTLPDQHDTYNYHPGLIIHNNHASGKTQIGTYISTIKRDTPLAIAITVGLSVASGLSIPRSIDRRLERALADTMNGKEAVDIKFYAFARKAFGYVTHPLPIYGKSSLLEGYSESLDLLISGKGFAESRLVDLDRHEMERGLVEDYDYLSDSDLDEDEEIEEEDSTSDKSLPPSSEGTLHPEPAAVPLPLSRPESTARRLGRVVVVRGTAFKTWKALLYYIYTGKISLSPVPQLVQGEFETPPCSAKSMYRLADKLGLEELKNLSLSSIRANLSRENIMKEVFSKFTAV
ncbi:hypothetical protein B0H11DRAFT_351529 [Mycena galericulata]|nr:hypothetical protein B0H11DRAFT_351529 [Mycena galericulata]